MLNLKIGTRASLLALTQSGLIKDQLNNIGSDKFELEHITTEGDVKIEQPLWQMEGKDFFTKELDQALLKNQVDLVVHSYKDLGSERPEGIKLVAITERKFSHDILLIKKGTLKKIENLDQLIVGTSSPRRIFHAENILTNYLPGNIAVKTKNLRGNVNTRIEKLNSDEYDAIILALAGLERLTQNEKSLGVLEELLKDMSFMILPQSHFPSSASQGALAIEANENSPHYKKIQELTNKVHNKKSALEIAKERKEFNSYGGGCHLAIGIESRQLPSGDLLTTISGEQDNKVIKSKMFDRKDSLPQLEKKSAFIGFPSGKMKLDGDHLIYDNLVKKVAKEIEIPLNHTYVTSMYCSKPLSSNLPSIWTSGAHTMRSLARKGFWVNGTSDALGDGEILNLLESKVVQMMIGKKDWNILTHKDSEYSWGKTYPAYTRELLNLSSSQIEDVRSCQAFYWTSFSQYLDYINIIPELKNKIHCCGLGKTFKLFRENNIKAIAFADIKSFVAWTALEKNK